jgi:hypothetical protein
VRFYCDSDTLHHLSPAKSRLPLLITLHIQTSGALSKALDIFEVASRLEHIMIHGCPSIRLPPLEQMSDFNFVDMPSTEITTAVSLMSSLSLGATSCLDFHLDEWRDRDIRSVIVCHGFGWHTSDNVEHLRPLH